MIFNVLSGHENHVISSDGREWHLNLKSALAKLLCGTQIKWKCVSVLCWEDGLTQIFLEVVGNVPLNSK